MQGMIVKKFQTDECTSRHDLSANYRDDKKRISRAQAGKGTSGFQVPTRENHSAAMGVSARQVSALQVVLPGDMVARDLRRVTHFGPCRVRYLLQTGMIRNADVPATNPAGNRKGFSPAAPDPAIQRLLPR
jgi:hypothetical protein